MISTDPEENAVSTSDVVPNLDSDVVLRQIDPDLIYKSRFFTEPLTADISEKIWSFDPNSTFDITKGPSRKMNRVGPSKMNTREIYDYDNEMDRVREARERAESFTKATIERRAAEQTWEEERATWVQGFEEKTATIEQLQRELASTVDALNKERQDNESLSRSNSPAMVTYLNHPPPPPESGGSSNRVLELLQQSQQETARAQQELASLKAERDALADQVAVLQRQMQRLTEDREKLVRTSKSNEGLLQFRSEQAMNSDTERGLASRREEELVSRLAATECKAKQLQNELVTTTADLRASKGYREALEQRVAEATALTLSSQTEKLLQSRLDDMEHFAQILTSRAEQAENALKTLMAASGLKSDRSVDDVNEDGYVSAHKAVEDGILRSRSSQKKIERFLTSLQDDEESPLEKIRQLGTATGSVLNMENEDYEEDDECARMLLKAVSPARKKAHVSSSPSPSKSPNRARTPPATIARGVGDATAVGTNSGSGTAPDPGNGAKKLSSSAQKSLHVEKAGDGSIGSVVPSRLGRPQTSENLGPKATTKGAKTTKSEPLRSSVDSSVTKVSSAFSRKTAAVDTQVSGKYRVARPLSAPQVRPGSAAGGGTSSIVSKRPSMSAARAESKPSLIAGGDFAIKSACSSSSSSSSSHRRLPSAPTTASSAKPKSPDCTSSSARHDTIAGDKAKNGTGKGKASGVKKKAKKVAENGDGSSSVAVAEGAGFDASTIEATATVTEAAIVSVTENDEEEAVAVAAVMESEAVTSSAKETTACSDRTSSAAASKKKTTLRHSSATATEVANQNVAAVGASKKLLARASAPARANTTTTKPTTASGKKPTKSKPK